MHKGDIWRCKKFPERSIKLIRRFKNDPLPSDYKWIRKHNLKGWVVVGIKDGEEIASEYEITEEVIKELWVNTSKRTFMDKVKNLFKREA